MAGSGDLEVGHGFLELLGETGDLRNRRGRLLCALGGLLGDLEDVRQVAGDSISFFTSRQPPCSQGGSALLRIQAGVFCSAQII